MFKYEENEIVASTKTENGICPNCDSDDIEYSTMDMDTDFCGVVAKQKCVCKHCGFEFTEWYRLAYDGFTADTIDHDYSFDEHGEMA